MRQAFGQRASGSVVNFLLPGVALKQLRARIVQTQRNRDQANVGQPEVGGPFDCLVHTAIPRAAVAIAQQPDVLCM
jgi:hypothetical protein